jgi:hypothetical protein
MAAVIVRRHTAKDEIAEAREAVDRRDEVRVRVDAGVDQAYRHPPASGAESPDPLDAERPAHPAKVGLEKTVRP